MPNTKILIYVPVPIYLHDGIEFIEAQAINGLRLWAKNFGTLTVMMPLRHEPPPDGWRPRSDLSALARNIEVIPLPSAYRPVQFLRHLPSVARTISAVIRRCDYLCFAIGGLIGDWGAVACLVASRMGRPFAVWTDRVESDVVWRLRNEGRLRRRLWNRLNVPMMRRLEKIVIGRASLGLFNGRETFEAYKDYCGGPSAVVHNIHIKRHEHISNEAITAKKDALSTAPLRIVYVGRLDPMKGVMDWVETLGRVAKAGVKFEAIWAGDGPERAALEKRVSELGLQDAVKLPGFVTDRGEILNLLRGAHMLVFCHKTPESPRCLTEALICGTPIVGYSGAFAADLIAPHGGGRLVGRNDVAALADTIIALSRNVDDLKDLIDRARKDGKRFDDESVFAHRSRLIRTHLLANPR